MICAARAFVFWLLLLGAGPGVHGAMTAENVLVLANDADPGSIRLARHYAAMRAIPTGNIIALPLPTTEVISWRSFVAQLWEPLLARLVREKWIDAMPMDLADPIGRRKFAPNGHRMAALVVCRGVPLKIAHDASLAAESPPFTQRIEFRTNAGCVDAELSLLPAPNYNINAFVPNPLFQLERNPEGERHVVRVSRLDGPTVDDALALVDRAIAAERDGLFGRAYVDLSDRDRVGNEWLESTARQLVDMGFETDIDRAPAPISTATRFDAPVLYFGWYAADVTGPFTLPGFRFPPGAIAFHIHSYSAASLRTPAQGWTAPFVARGVTATVGNVNEPYLELTHRPDLLLRALARGATFAEAAYFSLSVLSWQAVLIGDPLYRPFGSAPARDRAKAESPSSFSGYGVLSELQRLQRAGQREEALRIGREAFRAAPNLALAEALSTLIDGSGDAGGAAAVVVSAIAARPLRPDEWALGAQIARRLAARDRPADAVAVWRRVLASAALPKDLRVAWLPEAIRGAAAAGDSSLEAMWNAELGRIRALEKN